MEYKQTACVSLHILVNIHQGAEQAPDLAVDDKPEITLRASRQLCHATRPGTAYRHGQFHACTVRKVSPLR